MHKAPAAKLMRPVDGDVSAIHQPRDPNTLSNYNAWRCQHVTANLEIDFEGKKVRGNVLLHMKKIHENVDKIVLDTRYASYYYMLEETSTVAQDSCCLVLLGAFS